MAKLDTSSMRVNSLIDAYFAHPWIHHSSNCAALFEYPIRYPYVIIAQHAAIRGVHLSHYQQKFKNMWQAKNIKHGLTHQIEKKTTNSQ